MVFYSSYQSVNNYTLSQFLHAVYTDRLLHNVINKSGDLAASLRLAALIEFPYQNYFILMIEYGIIILLFIRTGMWNQIFLGSYMSLFVAIPFAYFFTESEGFAGSRKVNLLNIQLVSVTPSCCSRRPYVAFLNLPSQLLN